MRRAHWFVAATCAFVAPFTNLAAAQPAEEAPPEEEALPAEETVPPAESEDPATEALGPAPDAPAPAGMGVLWGVITDSEYEEPIIEGTVTATPTNGGSETVAITDFDGQFRLELPPGTYSLRVYYEFHDPRRLDGLTILKGQVERLDTVVDPASDGVDVIEVETDADTSSLEGQTLARQRASAVGDAVGRKEISRAGDKDAAEAATRVVGATIVGSRFVFIRGLGERYTNALLDGAPLPSPEPDRQTVPLDLFPSLMLDSLTIAKSFTPDVPGDFAGGSVRLKTRRLPEEFLFSASLSLGLNDQATFRERPSYDGGSLDFSGMDDGTRSRPESLPSYRMARGAERPDGSLVSGQELTDAGVDINSPMSAKRKLTPPNHGGNVVIGDSFDLGGDKLGLVGALSYSRSYEFRHDEVLRTFRAADLSVLNDLRADRGIDKVRWGTFLGATYEADSDNRFHLTAMHSRSSSDEAVELMGFHEERAATIVDTRLRFVSRGLFFLQLRGEHEIDDMDGAELSYYGSLSRALRDEPNSRGTVYQQDGDNWSFEDDSLSGSHFYSDMGETTIGGGLDYRQPLAGKDGPVDLQIGTAVSLRNREFTARRYRFRPAAGQSANPVFVCSTGEWDPSCPDQLFTDDNIRGGGDGGGPLLELEENTQETDGYNANLGVFAGYAMVDVDPTDFWRIIVGQRLEVTRQTIEVFSPFDVDNRSSQEFGSEILMPAFATVFDTSSDSKLRLSVTRTVARPQLREIAPFRYTDYFGAREVEGNPDLVNTRIINLDARFEYFPSLSEVLAVSFFYKNFLDPIEQVIVDSGARGIQTFRNADGADLVGIEAETRKNFGFITPSLEPLAVIANVTVAYSRLTIEQATTSIDTNLRRPLSYQSPYVVNLALDYSNEGSGTNARIQFNTAGRRLTQVGTNGLSDVYEQPRYELDLIAAQEVAPGLRVNASAKNLIDSPMRWTQGEENDEALAVREYRQGRTFSIGASYTY